MVGDVSYQFHSYVKCKLNNYDNNDKTNYNYIIHLLPLTIPLFGGISILDV